MQMRRTAPRYQPRCSKIPFQGFGFLTDCLVEPGASKSVSLTMTPSFKRASIWSEEWVAEYLAKEGRSDLGRASRAEREPC